MPYNEKKNKKKHVHGSATGIKNSPHQDAAKVTKK